MQSILTNDVRTVPLPVSSIPEVKIEDKTCGKRADPSSPPHPRIATWRLFTRHRGRFARSVAVATNAVVVRHEPKAAAADDERVPPVEKHTVNGFTKTTETRPNGFRGVFWNRKHVGKPQIHRYGVARDGNVVPEKQPSSDDGSRKPAVADRKNYLKRELDGLIDDSLKVTATLTVPETTTGSSSAVQSVPAPVGESGELSRIQRLLRRNGDVRSSLTGTTECVKSMLVSKRKAAIRLRLTEERRRRLRQKEAGTVPAPPPAVPVKRPVGRPRLHPRDSKPVRLTCNGRRVGRPPTSLKVKAAAMPVLESLRTPPRDPPPETMPVISPIVRLPVVTNRMPKMNLRSESPSGNAGSFRYRQIALRRHDSFVQIVLGSTTRVKNGLNEQVLNELKMALLAAKADDKCNAVLLNGTGSVFCSGVDLISLVSAAGSRSASAAERLASAVRDFVQTLLSFPKPLVAAVNGAAVGLGVAILPLFDLVYASDKATFHTPYAALGQTPEGGATLTLPLAMGFARANGLLLDGRKLTATEAVECGLVTQALWPATFMEEVVPRVRALAAQPSPATVAATKALVRFHALGKLEVTVDTECRMLARQWSSPECIDAIRNFLRNEEIV